jgi:hypothetical protein
MNQETTSSVGASEFSAESVDRLFGRLDEKVRQSPRDAVLIAFLAGALLQVFAIRHLVLTAARIILWLATPVLFVFTAWRLFQLGNSDGGLGRFFGFKR